MYIVRLTRFAQLGVPAVALQGNFTYFYFLSLLILLTFAFFLYLLHFLFLALLTYTAWKTIILAGFYGVWCGYEAFFAGGFGKLWLGASSVVYMSLVYIWYIYTNDIG
jgi:hypothetical protein